MRTILLLIFTCLTCRAANIGTYPVRTPKVTNYLLGADATNKNSPAYLYKVREVIVQGITIDGIIFDGCSLSANGMLPSISGVIAPAAPGPGLDWPDQLLNRTNWIFHGFTYNWARGGDCVSNINAWRYPTNAHLHAPGAAHNRVYVVDGMENDIWNGYSTNNIIASYSNLMVTAHADGYLLAGLITTTNTVWNATQGANLLAIVGWQRAHTNLLDFPLVDVFAMVTNPALQYVDNVHWNAQLSAQVADSFAVNVIPPDGIIWREFYLPGSQLKPDSVFTNATFQVGYTPDLQIVQPPIAWNNYGILRLTFETNAAYGYAIATIRSRDYVHSTWGEMQVYGNDLLLYPQNMFRLFDTTGAYTVLLTTDHAYFNHQVELTGAASYVTNSLGMCIYFGTTNSPTFSAAAGSQYITTGGGTAGMIYIHTNSSIATSWYPVKLN